MAASDPFRVLGLASTASRGEIIAARRRLAKAAHPDSGGTTEQMSAINEAVESALVIASRRQSGVQQPSSRSRRRQSAHSAARRERRFGTEVFVDQPSFVVEALPAVAFEGILLAIAALGDVTDTDPPYRLVADLADPIRSFCQLELLPEAAASMVSIAVARAPGSPAVGVETVRDAIIAELNALDWDELQ